MSTFTLRMGILSNWIRGPYRVQGEKYVAVQGAQARKIALADLRSGAELAPGVTLKSRASGDWVLSLPGTGSVSRLGLVGSRTVWDGAAGASLLSPEALELKLSSTRAYAVSAVDSKGQRTRVSFGLRADALTSGWAWNGKSISRSALYTLAAIAIHMALLMVPGAMDRLRALFPQIGPLAPLAELAEAPIPIEEQVVAPEGEGNDFGGSYSLMTDSERAAKSAEKAAASVQKNLGGVLSRLSGLKVNAPAGARNAPESGFMGALKGLTARLGSGAGGTASAAFQFVGQGKVGGSNAALFADPSKSLNNRDFEEALDAFRRSQGAARDCYEKALLKDENLAVLVDYEGMVSSGGRLGGHRYGISGEGSDEAQNQLKSCMNGVLDRVQMKPRLGGAKLKYQFIFKS